MQFNNLEAGGRRWINYSIAIDLQCFQFSHMVDSQYRNHNGPFSCKCLRLFSRLCNITLRKKSNEIYSKILICLQVTTPNGKGKTRNLLKAENLIFRNDFEARHISLREILQAVKCKWTELHCGFDSISIYELHNNRV